MFIRVCSVVCFGIFLIKVLSDVETKNMLAFAFCLSFMFGVFVGHCIFYFLLWKKKQNIISEIYVVIRNYESTAESDFDRFLYSEKSAKRKYEWYENYLMTYIDDLKYDNYVCDMDSIFFQNESYEFRYNSSLMSRQQIRKPRTILSSNL